MTILARALGLKYSYEGGAEALGGAEMELPQGELLGVIGPNGSGKSTLLNLLSGALSPSAGRAEILGRDVRSYTKADIAKLLAYVPSEFHIPYEFSALEIVLMGRTPHLAWWRDYSGRDSARAEEALREAGIFQLKDRSINSLSSGERQLVFLAQALAQEPRVLLLDEPTSHLDINYKMRIFDLLSRLCRSGLGVIVVSHDLNLLAAYAGRALVLRKGGQVFCGPAAQAMSAVNISAAYGIGDPAALERLMRIR